MKQILVLIVALIIANLAMADDSYDLAQKAKERAAKYKLNKNSQTNRVIKENSVEKKIIKVSENAEDSYDLAQKAKANAQNAKPTETIITNSVFEAPKVVIVEDDSYDLAQKAKENAAIYKGETNQNDKVNIIIINQNNNNNQQNNNQNVQQENKQEIVQDIKNEQEQQESVIVENHDDSYDLAQKAKKNRDKAVQIKLYKKQPKVQDKGINLDFFNLGVTKNGDYKVVPISFSFFPLPESQKTIHHLHFNLGVGYCDRLEGAALGIVNIIGEDAGPLVFGTVNIIGHNANGLLGSTVNVIGNNGGGFFGSVVNVIGNNMDGFMAGTVNIVGNNMNGFLAGTVNIVGGSMDGFQSAVVNIVGKEMDGFQAGLVNINGKMKGFQVGLVNIDGEIDGDALALIGIYGKGGQSGLQLWIDELGIANAAFRHGSKTMYNIYTAGLHVSMKYMTAGIGLGFSFNLGPIFLNCDAIASTMLKTDDLSYGRYNVMGKMRAYVGLNLFDFVKVYGGLSYNVFWQNSEQKFSINPVYGQVNSYQNNRISQWPGLFLGIEL